MNKKYWEDFYKTKRISKPTAFARFIVKYLKIYYPDFYSIIDLGCGNGRDSYFFAKKGHLVIGMDSAIQPKNEKGIAFYKSSINELFKKINNFDIVYSRFFIHSINDEEIEQLLNWTKNLFIAEFRAKEDVPILFKHHYRNKIDGNEILKKLINKNYEILYYIKSRNLAKYKTENPIIIRIIAKKIK